MEQYSQRKKWIDIAKGIGVILVIYGHTNFSDGRVQIWLYSFHMPLFFFLSGLTFNYKKYKDFKYLLKSKFNSIVVPYLILILLVIVMNFFVELLKRQLSIGFMLKQCIGIVANIRDSLYGPGLWFLPCIFVVYILMWTYMSISEKPQYALMLSFFGLVGGYLYCQYVDIPLPWAIDAAVVATFFSILGCYINNHEIRKKSSNIYIYIY